MARITAFVLVLLIVGQRPLHGQADAAERSGSCALTAGLPTSLTDDVADFERIAELAGIAPPRSRLIRRLSDEVVHPWCAREPGLWASRAVRPRRAGPSFRIRPARLLSVFNSAYPAGSNDGALWAGRGLSSLLEAGVDGSWGPLTVGIAPEIAFQQNQSFRFSSQSISSYSKYVYPWYRGAIDWPERFGDGAYWTVDPGQSFVRLDVRGLAVGASTENLWWGPSLRNPILMSNTAPGFPHIFLGTSRPLNVSIGHVELQTVWGRLTESDYFDSDPADNHTLFAAIIGSFQPAPLPGFRVGGARVYLERIPPAGLAFQDFLLDAYRSPGANPRGGAANNNQLLSLFARWAFPASGFEAYAELAREDNWDGVTDLFTEPDHSQAYMLGFQKVLPLPGRWWRVQGELTHLGSSETARSGRPVVTYYIHSQIRQGYTQRGQLLGAGIGPGSDAQYLAVDRFTASGSSGAYVQRIRHDADAYYKYWAALYGSTAYDVEIGGGVRHTLLRGPYAVSAELGLARRYNRDFLGLDQDPARSLTETNWSLRITARWTP